MSSSMSPFEHTIGVHIERTATMAEVFHDAYNGLAAQPLTSEGFQNECKRLDVHVATSGTGSMSIDDRERY